MRSSKPFALVSVILLFVATSAPSQAQELVLTDVPTYYWYHGCTPTSGMMLFGYWDAHGYANLISGSNDWATNETNIKNAIASSGHISDYALYDGVDDYGWADAYTDMSEINPGGAHTDNCLADFMGTSRSAPLVPLLDPGRTQGSTWPTSILRFLGPEAAEGLDDYATYKGYSFDVNHDGYLFSPSWDTFVKEIQFGRPVVLNVDSSGSGNLDHSVCAIGYRTSNGYNEYAFRSTWESDGTEVQWARWRDMSSSYAWGVDSMERVRPDGTWDTAWDVGSASWHSSSSWDNGIPNTSAFTYFPTTASATIATSAQARMVNNQGTIYIQSSLSVGDLRNSGGQINLENGTLTATRAIVNDSGDLCGWGTIDAAVDNMGSGAICATGAGSRQLSILGDMVNGPGSTLWADADDTLMVHGEVDNMGTIDVGPHSTVNLVGGFIQTTSPEDPLGKNSGSVVIRTGGRLILPSSYPSGAWWNQGAVQVQGGALESHALVNDGMMSISDGEVTSTVFGVGCYLEDGVVVQTGGTNTVADEILIGWKSYANGRYVLSGGTVSTNELAVGHSADNGVFEHSGGSVNVGTKVTIGDNGSGSYYLSGTGQLSAPTEQLGWWGTGRIFQTGGVNSVTTELILGRTSGSTGSYELGGSGELLAAKEYVGYYGHGSVVQTGGTNDSGSRLYIAYLSGSSGEYIQSGGTTRTDWLLVGQANYPYDSTGRYVLSGTGVLETQKTTVGNGGTGEFVQSGGTHSVDDTLTVGYTGGGSYRMSAGLLEADRGLIVLPDDPVEPGAQARFVHEGGTARFGSLYFGWSSGWTGQYELSGSGLLEVGNVYLGGANSGAHGEFLQSGGECRTSDSLYIGYSSGSTGAYRVSGGTLAVEDLYVGYSGAGTLELANAASNVSVSGRLRFGQGASLDAVLGAEIRMTGAAFENTCTDPTALAGMSNLTLVFEGGGTVVDPFEVGSAIDGGFVDNFALGSLVLGGSDVGLLQLFDYYDNGNRGTAGMECLFLHDLLINPGSMLDVNSLGLYVEGDVASLLDAWIGGSNSGLLRDSSLAGMDYLDAVYDTGNNWTTLTVVPEPSSLCLLSMAAGLFLRDRRFRHRGWR